MPSVLPALAFTLVLQAPDRRAAALDDGEQASVIYYDYVENGELRGGTVAIDPTNPLHVDTGEARVVLANPVTTLVYNGPPARRIDLVFVGDGYTAGELGQYAADVDAVWPTFLSEPPLSEYASYFNVHRVDVTSAQSGVDNDPVQGIQRQTSMDMGYWCSGIQRLLCIDVAKAESRASSAPDVDSILALANSSTYGGAGYTDLGTLAGRNSAAIEIALHEFGHSFARLADEYSYGGPTTYVGSEPTKDNITIYTEAQLTTLRKKWFRWFDLPHVGTFQGANYSLYGIYRPTFNSKMRNLGRPFEEVNSERFVRHIYGRVRPIDDATPEGAYPLDTVFFVDPMDPVTHTLDVQWSLDGVPIRGATGTSLDAGSLGLSLGTYVLSVHVMDNTPLVRNPSVRWSFLSEGRTWVLTDGKKVRPHDGPGGTGPILTLTSAPAVGGELEFELDAPAWAAPAGAVPLLFLASAPDAGSGARFATGLAGVGSPWAGPGRPARLRVSVPHDLALLEQTFLARGAFLDRAAPRGSRLVWTSALEVTLQR